MELKWRHPLEGDDELVSEYTSGVLHDDGNSLGITELEALFETGSEPIVSSAFPVQPVGPGISGNAPDGISGIAWGPYNYTATGGTGGLTFRVQAGSLPTGFKLTSSGELIQATPATVSTSAFTIRVTDANGLYADLADTIAITTSEVLPPQLTDWRYLQVDASDGTDYSGSSFDDSAWAVGAAPFGGWEPGWDADDAADGAPDGFTYPPLFDPRFAEKFGTPWGANTRLWMRRTLSLGSAPPSGIRVHAYIEDWCVFYINGVIQFYTPQSHDGGVGQIIDVPESALVAGENVIAIRCDDEAPNLNTSVVYADFIIEVL